MNKFLKAIQKGIKAGLLESGFNFSLDDLDHMEDYGLKKKKLNKEFFKDEFIKQQDQYEKFIFLSVVDKVLNEQPLLDKEKEQFNVYSNKLIAVYKVNDLEELNHLIYKIINVFGNEINLNWINVSNIDNMAYLFYDTDIIHFPENNFKNISKFNGDISKWDVSHIESMKRMFAFSHFNKDISMWNVSRVETMDEMFAFSHFTKEISEWNVSNVKNMAGMFEYSEFNGNISKWDVSHVKNMHCTFSNSIFNRDISEWDVSHVESMCGMFRKAKFNQDISKWDVSNVTNMDEMFTESKFNQDISGWDVSNVNQYKKIFSNCHIKEEYKPQFKQY